MGVRKKSATEYQSFTVQDIFLSGEMEELQEAITSCFPKRDNTHGLQHANAVVERIKMLFEDWPQLTEKHRKDTILLGFLHDLNDPKYASEDNLKDLRSLLHKFLLTITVEQAESIIQRASWSDEQKQLITFGRRDWDIVLKEKPLLLMRHILSDADKLEAIGLAGLLRSAEYLKNQKLFSQEEIYEKVEEHATSKLLRIRDYLHSPGAIKKGWILHDELIQALKSWKPQVTLENLSVVGSGLNIEGGSPCVAFKLCNPKGIWANLVWVLDQPLSGPTFDSLLKEKENKGYPILENTLLEFNEPQMLSTSLVLMNYYAENSMKGAKIVVHIHQFPECSKYLIEFFRGALNHFISWSSLVEFEFQTDTPTFRTTNPEYQNKDVLISLSQCASLERPYGRPHPVGSIFTCNTFVPWDVKENIIRFKDRYTVENQLCDEKILINCFLENKSIPSIITYVNENYLSSNPLKRKDQARTSKKIDFTKVPALLQVNDIWNPSNTESQDLQINSFIHIEHF